MRWPLSLRMSLAKVSFEPVLGDRFRIIGEDGSVDAMTIHFPDADSGHAAGGGGSAREDIDWDDVAPKRSRGSGGKSKGSGGDGAAHSEVVHFVEDVGDVLRAAGIDDHDEVLRGFDIAAANSSGDEDSEGPLYDDDVADEVAPPSPSSLHVGGSSSSSSAPPLAPPPVTPDTASRVLFHVDKLDEMERLMPEYRINYKWHVLRSPFTDADRMGVVRCIAGSPLVVSCSLHGKRCKLHVDICGRFEHAQCVLLRWQAAASSFGHEAHAEHSKWVSGAWRRFCQSGELPGDAA